MLIAGIEASKSRPLSALLFAFGIRFVGATGARLMTTMLNELERTGGRYGMELMCCGGGLGTATIIERLD